MCKGGNVVSVKVHLQQNASRGITRVLQQRFCGWLVAESSSFHCRQLGGQVSHLPLPYLHLYCLLFTCLGLCRRQQPLVRVPRGIKRICRATCWELPRDKAVFRTPTSSTKTELQKMKNLVFLNIVGLYSTDALKSLLLKLSSWELCVALNYN